jgi:hypothetical protein
LVLGLVDKESLEGRYGRVLAIVGGGEVEEVERG